MLNANLIEANDEEPQTKTSFPNTSKNLLSDLTLKSLKKIKNLS